MHCISRHRFCSPHQDEQAQARAHRIGQTRPVNVYRLICRGSIEERLLQIAEKKLYLHTLVNRGDQFQV